MRAILKAIAAAAMTAALAVLASPQAAACPTCYGQAQGPVIDGLSTAILAMIGITGFVLSGVAAMFVSIGRRARRIDAAPAGGDQRHNDNGAE
jgi:hypothetical protein